MEQREGERESREGHCCGCSEDSRFYSSGSEKPLKKFDQDYAMMGNSLHNTRFAYHGGKRKAGLAISAVVQAEMMAT